MYFIVSFIYYLNHSAAAPINGPTTGHPPTNNTYSIRGGRRDGPLARSSLLPSKVAMPSLACTRPWCARSIMPLHRHGIIVVSQGTTVTKIKVFGPFSISRDRSVLIPYNCNSRNGQFLKKWTKICNLHLHKCQHAATQL